MPSTTEHRVGGVEAMMQVYSRSLAVTRGLGTLAHEIARIDPDLARQLRRAAASVPLNIAEAELGRGRKAGASFAIAFGSAREARACVDVAFALGYLANDINDSLRDDLDHVIATLYKLSR